MLGNEEGGKWGVGRSRHVFEDRRLGLTWGWASSPNQPSGQGSQEEGARRVQQLCSGEGFADGFVNLTDFKVAAEVSVLAAHNLSHL